MYILESSTNKEEERMFNVDLKHDEIGSTGGYMSAEGGIYYFYFRDGVLTTDWIESK